MSNRERNRGFLRSEDGSLIIFGLMIFLLMLLAGGMGVDFMRYEAQRARLQATLDRAVLAAASMDQPLDPKTVVLDYFEKAGLGYYIDASSVNVIDKTTSRRVEAEARMDIGASFLRFAGIDFLTAPAYGAAEEVNGLTEISLVLDTSGSMDDPSASGKKKIVELRDAATKFINIVLCDPAYPDRTTPCTVPAGKVSVSIVPYAEQVLVGETLLGYFGATNEHNYSSCVDFDGADYTSTVISPTAGIQRAGHIDPWPLPYRWDQHDPDYAFKGQYEIYPPIMTCRTDSWREITPVTDNAQHLRNRIALLEGNGSTSIDIGMKWGAGLLDPAAQPVVDALIADGSTDADLDGRPFDKDEERVEKVIVLMTDGQNTGEYELNDGFYSGPSPFYRNLEYQNNNKNLATIPGDRWSVLDDRGDADPDNDRYWWVEESEWHDHPFGAEDSDTFTRCSGWGWGSCKTIIPAAAETIDYADFWAMKPFVWYEKWNWLPTPGVKYETDVKNARLKAVCDAAKAEDVMIFAIGFEVPANSDSDAVMHDCASTDAHYFSADGTDLASAFAAIAREIAKLRLVN